MLILINTVYLSKCFMDIRQLQFLCALDQHRHFGRAAEACHVTQPTLSMRLKNLEEELGVALINRRQRFEGFTQEGERLLNWAHQSVAAFEGMKTEARRLQGELVGTLRIGMVPLSHVELMPALQQLRKHSPHVRLQLHALSSQQIIAGLEANQLDVGLTYLAQAEMAGHRIWPLGTPKVGLLYHPDFFAPELSPSAGTEQLSWTALSSLPLGLLSESMRFRQGLERCAKLQGIDLAPVLESDSVEHLLEGTSHGLCCTLIPLPAPHSSGTNGLRTIAMEESLPQSPLALVCQDSQYSHNPLVQALIQRLVAEH
ncbi:LysR family transcriptional regulator [Granulosicoccaceae sp. 1_MG-2023]|nr:LysR family transcriptional regulator [Granulosicoccaceae sp. 1_MG-2023]